MTILLLALVASCAKPDSEGYLHEECKIRTAYIKANTAGSPDMIYGVIDESAEPATITFKIIKPKWDLYDLEHMRLRVNVTYDVMVEPSLAEKTIDLSDYDTPFALTVRNTVTGASKLYHVMAYKSVDTE